MVRYYLFVVVQVWCSHIFTPAVSDMTYVTDCESRTVVPAPRFNMCIALLYPQAIRTNYIYIM